MKALVLLLSLQFKRIMITLQADLFGKRYEYGHKAFKCGPFWICQIIMRLIEGSVKSQLLLSV